MKRILIFVVVSIIFLTGCNQKESTDSALYIGKNGEWLISYTIAKVNDEIYDLLSIQYIGIDSKNIGEFTYKFKGTTHTLESSEPQILDGIGNFQIMINYSPFDLEDLKESYELNINWNNLTEEIILERK